MTSPDRAPWAAIVLTGGTGRRLAGLDKATVSLGGVRAIDRLLDALPSNVDVIVAGPSLVTARHVRFQAEDPPGGGPVSGIVAALPLVTAQVTAVVAVDMPWAGRVLPLLVAETERTAADVVLPVDDDGRAQYLCCTWRTDALRRAVGSLDKARNAPVKALLPLARVHEWHIPPDLAQDFLDIDDASDLAEAQRRADATTLGKADD